jgi:hypothetical protein
VLTQDLSIYQPARNNSSRVSLDQERYVTNRGAFERFDGANTSRYCWCGCSSHSTTSRRILSTRGISEDHDKGPIHLFSPEILAYELSGREGRREALKEKEKKRKRRRERDEEKEMKIE